ncbi:venom prothrombin activator porpharin-D-like [Metopolophium dirhodum]|uniref:venom prothrombin activator porpharin-D-like n=1 Tax=Metopolophium dirhodum TaxID=44670 RepID=UPI00298FA0D5|nr:venom prothrombin activator porpharin-D-like [Metopolophium dirhodum]
MKEKKNSRIILYSCLIFASGMLCYKIFERRLAVPSSFVNTEMKFNCSNGVSIKPSKVCDGRKDCSDGSDETVALCDRNEYGKNFTRDCGRVYINQETIVNGQKANVGTAPWHAEIYRFVKNVSNYEFLCGGSIISSNLVVSGARSFWHNDMSSNIISNIDGLYKIAVGKYDGNVSIIDNNFTQIMDVDSIYLKETFSGSSRGVFAYDIAIVVLKTRISFSYYVAPVCIDWNGKYNVVNGDYGKIVGLGYKNNESSSPVIRELSLPYVDRSTCQNILHTNGFDKYVTVDKFCAGSALVAGEGAGVGYAAAGLSFFHDDSYYITGITSLKESDSNNSITIFTEVQYHTQWLRGLYDKYK